MKIALEELNANKAKALLEFEARAEILESLPDDLQRAPTISNIVGGSAWLSFSAPFHDQSSGFNDPSAKPWDPAGILLSLERAGFKQSPATLCQWGPYRPSAYVGLMSSIPAARMEGSHEVQLKDAKPIAPLWLEPCQHMLPEACLFMFKGNKTYKVCVDLPRPVVSLQARRVEYAGGWHWGRGTERVAYPAAWESLEGCKVLWQAYASEQRLDGSLFFVLKGEQDKWPTPASEFLAGLLHKWCQIGQ